MKETTKDKLLVVWGPPILLFVLLALAYGVMLRRLGYAFDDWHFIYYSTRGIPGLSEIFHYDGHPQEAWLYILSFKLLGSTPLYWHLYALIWRWLAVWSFWLCLKALWPDQHRQNFFVAALFALHPIYTLQVFPICFFDVWLAYTLLFLSFYLTILAIQNPDKGWIFMMAAFVLAVGRVFTSEYTWFVELMRPLFIWLILPAEEPRRKKITQTVMRWLPFLAVFIASLIWRGFFITSTRKYFQVSADLFLNPFKFIFTWSLDLLPDISNVLVTAWYETFRADYIYFVKPLNVILFGVTIL